MIPFRTIYTVYFAVGVIGAGQTSVPQPKSDTASRESSAPAKCSPECKPAPATLSGKVFAITKGGDLKQARFAQVFVMSGDSATEFNAAMLPNDEVVSEFKKVRDQRETNPLLANPSDAYVAYRMANVDSTLKVLCNSIINTPKDTVLKLVKVHPDQVVTLETDEEGFFKTDGLKPGAYTVLVVGRAGANDGFWVENVALEAGKDGALKMRTPVMVCLNP